MTHDHSDVSRKKSLWAFFGFGFVGIAGWLLAVSDWRASLPLGVFYAVLVVNTYFSVRLFSRITPQGDRTQILFDTMLAFLFMGGAASMGNTLSFMFINLLLFIAAVAKYAFLLGIVPQPGLLRRKILVDLSGVAACAFAFGGALSGYPFASAWALAVAFAIANVFLFFVRPLYRLDAF